MLTEFHLNPDLNEAFTEGDCWRLALALHQITGWTMIAVGCQEGDNPGWVHMGVRSPEGYFVDVLGMEHMKKVPAMWSAFLRHHCNPLISSCAETYEIDVEDWEWMTQDQGSRYPEFDASLTAQEVLAAYIEFTLRNPVAA